MSSSDRALIAAFKEISTMADRINLPKTIVDRANNLFKQVSQLLNYIHVPAALAHSHLLNFNNCGNDC